jgi:ATP-dependent exoDNAse (exonuclease V) beta subunit
MIEPAELRLLYVAVTRASHKLDPYSCPMLMSLPQYGSEVVHDESVLQIASSASRQLDAPDAVQVMESRFLPEVYLQGALFSL